MSAVKRQLEDEKDSRLFQTIPEREAWVKFAAAAIADTDTTPQQAAATADCLLEHFRQRCRA